MIHVGRKLITELLCHLEKKIRELALISIISIKVHILTFNYLRDQ